MKKRIIPRSALFGFVITLFLLTVNLILPGIVQLLLYIHIKIGGFEIYLPDDALYIIFFLFVFGGLIVPIATVLIRLFSNDNVSRIAKNVCDVLVTLVFSLACLPVFRTLVYYYVIFAAGNSGVEEVIFCVYLAVAYCLAFVKIGFRINRNVGNTVLAVLTVGFLLVFVSNSPLDFIMSSSIADLASQACAYVCFFCPVPFLALCIFEQVLRKDDGKLTTLSRIFLTVCAILSLIYTVIAFVSTTLYIMSYGFTNMRLVAFAITASAIVFYVNKAVKIQR